MSVAPGLQVSRVRPGPVGAASKALCLSSGGWSVSPGGPASQCGPLAMAALHVSARQGKRGLHSASAAGHAGDISGAARPRPSAPARAAPGPSHVHVCCQETHGAPATLPSGCAPSATPRRFLPTLCLFMAPVSHRAWTSTGSSVCCPCSPGPPSRGRVFSALPLTAVSPQPGTVPGTP